MRILFAGIIARYPFGGVTWCSLMYLLGLRALGHEVFYIEDTGECVYDPILNTRRHRSRRTARPTSTPRSSRSASAIAGRSSTTTAAITAAAPTTVQRYAPTPTCSSISRADRGSGATSTRASRARSSSTPIPAFTQLAIAKAEPWYVEFFQRFDHLFTFGSNIGTPASTIPTGDFTWHKTWQPVTLDDWQHRRAAGRSLHDRDDLADRELRRRRRQQGSGVHQVHRPAVADAAAVRAGDQRAADAAAAARLGHRRCDAASRARRGTTAISSSARRRSSASPSTPTSPSRSGWFSDRTECYLASGRPALVQDTGWTAHLPHGDGLLAFSTPDEALAGIDRINSDYARATRGTARRDRARAFRRRASSLPRAARRTADAHAADRPRRPGRDHRFRRPSPARSRR